MNTKSKIMKIQKATVVSLSVSCMLFFVVSACANYDHKSYKECITPIMVDPRLGHVDYQMRSFLDGVSIFSDCSDVYVIRGMAQEAYEYGLNISLVEDYKGNFPKNLKQFIVWGEGGYYTGMGMDGTGYTNKYAHSELVMLLTPVQFVDDDSLPEFTRKYIQENTFFEKPGDFCTIPWISSIVHKLSNGNVTGAITHGENLFEYMSWKTFQKKLRQELKFK